MADDIARFFDVSETPSTPDAPKAPNPSEPKTNLKPPAVEVPQKTLRPSDEADNRKVDEFGPNDYIVALAVSPMDQLVAIVSAPSSSKEQLQIWNSATGELVSTLAENVNYSRDITWSQDGNSIFLREQSRVLEFHVPSGQRRVHILNRSDLTFLQLQTNDLKWVGLPFPTKFPFEDAESHFQNLADKYVLDNFGYFIKFKKKERKSKSLSLSPDEVDARRAERAQRININEKATSCVQPIGNLQLGTKFGLAALYDSSGFCIWDLNSGEPIRVVSRVQEDQVRSANVSSDGNLIAIGLQSGDLEIWDAINWKLLRTLSGHKSAVTSLAFDGTGQGLVSGGDDGRVNIWNILNGIEVVRYSGNDNGGVGHVAFTSENKKVLSTTYMVDVWPALLGAPN